MAKDSKPKLEFSEAEIKALKQIKEYKKICESNIVSILFKQPELFYNYDNLTVSSFMHNEWKVFFAIGNDLVVKENKTVLDEMTINLYLEKHKKLKEKYIEYGGYEIIELAKTYVKIENIEGYIQELSKWNTIINLAKAKFPIAHRLKDFVDMKLEDIYDEYEAVFNHIFINAEGEDKSYDISDGIYDLIDKLDDGIAVGLPLYNSPMLTNETGGNLNGNITLCGGLSGMGKTTLSRTLLVPSILKEKEKLVVMINEEGLSKWQREMLVWVANNVYKEDTQKYKLRDGKYTPEFKTFLKDKCAQWIIDRKKQIIIVPFTKYSTSKAIKCIKKYCHMGVKYFMLDTYKADSDTANSDAFWFNLQQNMVKIYDTIKEENKNVHIWITFQLAKSSSKQRFYSQDNIGMAKNIVNVASTCIMVRGMFEDEFQGGKHELKVYKLGGKNKKTKIPVELDKNKHYQILFVVKNREGSSNDYQIVVEHDLSRNVYNEIGLTCVPVDF